MSIWQVSCKREAGGTLEVREFLHWWRVVLWMVLYLRDCRIVMIVKMDE